MEGWSLFWSVFFFLSLVLFAGLAVVVSLGGVSDILSLFRKLKEP